MLGRKNSGCTLANSHVVGLAHGSPLEFQRENAAFGDISRTHDKNSGNGTCPLAHCWPRQVPSKLHRRPFAPRASVTYIALCPGSREFPGARPPRSSGHGRAVFRVDPERKSKSPPTPIKNDRDRVLLIRDLRPAWFLRFGPSLQSLDLFPSEKPPTNSSTACGEPPRVITTVAVACSVNSSTLSRFFLFFLRGTGLTATPGSFLLLRYTNRGGKPGDSCFLCLSKDIET